MVLFVLCLCLLQTTARAETIALIGGGGGEYSYFRVTSDVFLSKSSLITTDFNRNSSGRMRCSSLWVIIAVLFSFKKYNFGF